jgi:hypothetical protein
MELPIKVPLAREDGTLVSTPHRDHHIRCPHELGGEPLRISLRDIEPEFVHRLDHRGVDLVGR